MVGSDFVDGTSVVFLLVCAYSTCFSCLDLDADGYTCECFVSKD